MTWLNADGLFVKFGEREAAPGRAGEYNVLGPQGIIELVIDPMTALGTNATIQEDQVVLSAGMRIEKVEVITTTAVTSGGSATLNIGLMRTNRTTELDFDGLVAALPLASFNAAGETFTATNGTTNAGALLGTTLAFNGYLTADWDTAAFTAGAIRVRIYFSRPVA